MSAAVDAATRAAGTPATAAGDAEARGEAAAGAETAHGAETGAETGAGAGTGAGTRTGSGSEAGAGTEAAAAAAAVAGGEPSRGRGHRMSRRRLLGLAGTGLVGAGLVGLGLAGPVLTAAPARAAAGQAPGGRALTARAGGGLRTGEGGRAVRHVAVSWNGPREGAAIRFRGPGGRVGRWRLLAEACPAAPDSGGGRAGVRLPASHQALAAVENGATDYELALPAGARDVRTALLAPPAGGPTGLPPAPPGPPRTARSAPRVPLTGSLDSSPWYLSREKWGGHPVWKLPNLEWEPEFHPQQVVTVHHTVTRNNDPDPGGTVRSIHHYHTAGQGWSDIGYHLLIDEAGRLYEGRWSGMDDIPGLDVYGRVVTGAHAGGFNTGNLGIALLGDFRERGPTPAARSMLVQLLAALARIHGFDPLGEVDYVNPLSEVHRRVPAICGHRDWMPTECPGRHFYDELQSIRQEVASLLG